jgi:hypothetical protein
VTSDAALKGNRTTSERRRWQSDHLALFLVCFALVYGATVSHIPAPRSPGTFWIANLLAPWLLLAVVAGLRTPTLFGALSWAAANELALSVGFYARMFRRSSAGSSVTAMLGDWLPFLLPRALLAVLVGCLMSGLAYAIRRRSGRGQLRWALLAAPLLLEPAFWALTRGRFEKPLALWAAEFALGALFLTWGLTRVDRCESPSSSIATT